jgi:glyoxylase-like metal-dependent hydrolase (beta-lactamase superfamily II)
MSDGPPELKANALYNRALTKGDTGDVQGSITDRQIEEYASSMKRRQNRVADFVAPCSSFDPGQSVLLVLREWNSYTPAVPAADKEDRGGRYFLWHLAQGIVIDPGYDFIEHFFRARGRVHDIHHVVVSHSHHDHTADLESILTLIHEYNDRPTKPGKQIRLYLSQDAYRKHAGLPDLWRPSISDVVVLNRGDPDNPQVVTLYKGATLTVLRAYHDDEVTQGCAVGLGLELQTVAGLRRLVFTCDTGA